MPAVSKKQEKFMQAVTHNPKFAKKVGVPQSVGREFSNSGGGEMKESKTMMKKGGSAKKYAAGGLAAGHKSADGIAKKGKTKGMEVKMAMGGKARKGCK
jgi:hypothetical protein